MYKKNWVRIKKLIMINEKNTCKKGKKKRKQRNVWQVIKID